MNHAIKALALALALLLIAGPALATPPNTTIVTGATSMPTTFGATAVPLGATVSGFNAVTMGLSTAAAGNFTALNATSIGATTPGTGVFTTLNATSVGASTPGTGAFTSLAASSTTTFTGLSSGTAVKAVCLNSSNQLLANSTNCFAGGSFVQPVTGATTITAQIHTQFQVNMVDFMTAGQPDGTTDNSADFAKLNNYCSLHSGSQNNGITVYLAPLVYQVHDVTYTCGIHFIGTMGDTPNLSNAGTELIYSSASDHMIEWEPPSWPSVPRTSLIGGVGFENIGTYTSNSSSSIAALRIFGAWNPIVNHVEFNGSQGDLIDMYGGYSGDFSNINGGSSGVGFLFRGDLAGLTESSTSCSTGNADCSTRLDVPRIQHVNLGGTGVCFEFRGFVQTPQMDHTTCEGAVTDVKADCPNYSPALNINQCPAFFRGFDVEGEGASSYSFDLSDFTDFRCDQCYAVGANSPPSNTIYLRMVNFSETGGAGGGFYWSNGTVYNASNDCIYSTVSDVHIIGGYIQYCALGGNTGYSGVSFQDSIGNDSVTGTQFCSTLGYGSSMTGVRGNTNIIVRVDPSTNLSGCSTPTAGTTQIGQSVVVSPLAVSLTTGTVTRIAATNLYPGNYSCYASFYTNPGGSTVQTNDVAGLSTTDVHINGTPPDWGFPATATAGDSEAGTAGPYPIAIASGLTPIYASIYNQFSGGSLTAEATINCQRTF